MIVKEYMLSKEELKHDFPIGSKHIIDGKEVVVTEIHDPMTANCMASYPMVFLKKWQAHRTMKLATLATVSTTAIQETMSLVADVIVERPMPTG